MTDAQERVSSSLAGLPGSDVFPVPAGGFLDLPAERRDPDRSAAAVIPVPYDKTSTFVKGADRGPAALLWASAEVEWHEIELDTEPSERGVVTRAPVLCDGPPEELAALVRSAVGHELDGGRLPIVLGGEHSATIGAVEAAAARFGGSLTVVQIDAHADTRHAYHGSTHNHACVMARARERAPIVQIGIRSMSAEERPGLDMGRVVFAHEIAADRGGAWLDRVGRLMSEHVYLTVDLDGFDPSLVPATGTPEPGGLGWWQVVGVVDRIVERSVLVGADVVELCPRGPMDHASAFLAARLVHRVLGAAFGERL